MQYYLMLHSSSHSYIHQVNFILKHSEGIISLINFTFKFIGRVISEIRNIINKSEKITCKHGSFTVKICLAYFCSLQCCTDVLMYPYCNVALTFWCTSTAMLHWCSDVLLLQCHTDVLMYFYSNVALTLWCTFTNSLKSRVSLMN